MKKSSTSSALLGAAFLMATSAIGPGFITQTTVFTQQLLSSFGFVILCSIILDIGAQMNTWRIIAMSELRAQDIANKLLPGLGYFLAVLVVIGGLAFNIGNVAGAGLGINVIAGTDTLTGAIISAIIGIFYFWYKDAARAMDWFTKILGIVMIGLTLYVAIRSGPPVEEAIQRSFWPEQTSIIAIVTLVGGTVGGYISFAGAHRLLDAGVVGRSNLISVTRSSITGIMITGGMRIILFLAVLGVVSSGGILNPENPAASVFHIVSGDVGFKIFGVVLWSAAITSVVGSAYTSVSFIRTFHPWINKHHRWVTIIFIVLSTIIFAFIGQPIQVLVVVGALNGLILPVALAVMLVAARRYKIVKDYKHPLWMQLAGWVVVVLMTWMGYFVIARSVSNLF